MNKLIKLFLCSCLCLSLFACGKEEVKDPVVNQRFNEFLNDLFIEQLEENYLMMHTYVENPTDYGIEYDREDITIGEPLNKEYFDEQREEIDELLNELNQFKVNELYDEEQAIYNSLIQDLTLQKKLCDPKFDYYEPVLSTMSGIHAQLPTLLSDWVFRNENDVEEFIIYLDTIDEYMDSIIWYCNQQITNQSLMVDIDNVKEYCQGILAEQDNSPILASISDSIKTLKLDNEADYLNQIKDSLNTNVYPCYQDMIDFLDSIEVTNNKNSYYYFKDGQEYYALLFQYKSNSNSSFEQLATLIENELNEGSKALSKLLSEHSEAATIIMFPNTITSEYTCYEDILTDIEHKMANDFPRVNNHDYEIKDINKNIASDGVAAYFNIPAIDATTKRQMRVNPNNDGINSITTYISVAHEGFPGHMYHYNYVYENIDSNFAKVCLDNQALCEGYATYASYYALNYLDIDESYIEAYKLNELLNNYLVLYADIGIHFMGWTLDDLNEAFGTSGGLEPLYNQLSYNPAAFVPYYIGYIQIENLVQKAQESLKDDFNHQKFIEVLLQDGFVSFVEIEKNIDEYLNSKH